MIKIENYEVVGWEHAIRGMRNPKNSWDRMDSDYADDWDDGAIVGKNYWKYEIGPNDHKLMMQLNAGGPVHAKYRRMITVYVDITAPLYWWKEFDTYKVGSVANSCSTMHKIHAKEFVEEDFSFEKIEAAFEEYEGDDAIHTAYVETQHLINALGRLRYRFNETGDKKYWDAMIQLLPSSYNQKRTVMLNYEVLTNIYKWRRDHKLDEWHTFCDWIEKLPYSELIIGKKDE